MLGCLDVCFCCCVLCEKSYALSPFHHLSPSITLHTSIRPDHDYPIINQMSTTNYRTPSSCIMSMLLIKVDVIIAVYNGEETIEETIQSAMHQVISDTMLEKTFSCKLPSGKDEIELFCMKDIQFDVLICCYNDASTDKSLDILHRIENEPLSFPSETVIPAKVVVGTAPEGTSSRGAGYARNQAAKLRSTYELNNLPTQKPLHHFLCILDSDDIMHPTRIAEQTNAMLSLGYDVDDHHLSTKTLMGCQFDRIPKDSTWHYQNWANSLSDDRLYLEKFRECTLIQPTWYITKERFDLVGGYIEAPAAESKHQHCIVKRKVPDGFVSTNEQQYQLIHSSEMIQSIESTEKNSLRLAEDLRFFYAHLLSDGKLHLHRTPQPLVSYRHRSGMSQSSSTPRKLLLKLRAKAWEDLVYNGRQNGCNSNNSALWSKGFAIWGAGRDGKDFYKALSLEVASAVVCFVDVDEKKINKIKFYDNSDRGIRIPILHFSALRKVQVADNSDTFCYDSEAFGRIDKRKENALSHLKKKAATDRRVNGPSACTRVEANEKKSYQNDLVGNGIDMASLPVVICVAMYRTNGALESNVSSIGRVEGENLWHIC